MSFGKPLACALLLGVLTPGTARADGMIIPFAGVNFGGGSGQEIADAIDAKRANWGISFAYMGAGVLGIEADFGYSPDFFGKTDVGGSSVLTATGNLLLGIPIGGQTGVGVRPYVLAGLGVLRSEVDAFEDLASLDDSKLSWDFGGGVMFFFGTHVGLRGDIRYFRSFDELDLDPVKRPERLEFGRASAGLILRF